jgi:hypothetical protein
MIKYLLSAVLFFCLQGAAEASVNGAWIGWGDWTFDGSGDHCDMTLNFKETATTLTRVSGHFACTAVGLALPAETWTIQNETLISNGEAIGKITEGLIEMREKYNDNVSIQTVMKIDGHHMDYEEIWTEKNNRVLYDIKGRLFLKESSASN